MAEISLARTTAASPAKSGFALCGFTLVSGVLLQKIALPGTGGLFPVTLLIFPVTTAAAFLTGVIEINSGLFIWYALFAVMATLSAVLSPSPHVSVLSLGLLVVAQMPLVFRCISSEISYPRLLNFLSIVGCLTAVIGILQFAGQFFVGVDAAFFLDKHLPDNVTVSGYNSLIPLYWSSPIYKSNGVFFLEPSFFGQFLAVAMVGELLAGPRTLRLILLTAGMVCSYSGTGLTMLALFLPFYFLRHGHPRLFFFVGAVSLVLIFFGDALSLDAFTRRLSEFSDVESSGWARFLSMFRVLQTVIFANDLTFFLGRGPGTVQEEFRQFSFYAFDPTWGKVIYEYGLLGSLVYFRFLYLALCKGPQGLRFAVGYTYLFLGGYLLNPSVLMQVAALVVWLGKSSAATRTSRPGANAVQATNRFTPYSDEPALVTG